MCVSYFSIRTDFVCVDVCVWACGEDDTYIIIEELHDKGGHAAVNTNEEVDAGQHHVSCAGHAEDEGERVHHGRDSPALKNTNQSKTMLQNIKYRS